MGPEHVEPLHPTPNTIKQSEVLLRLNNNQITIPSLSDHEYYLLIQANRLNLPNPPNNWVSFNNYHVKERQRIASQVAKKKSKNQLCLRIKKPSKKILTKRPAPKNLDSILNK